MHDAGLNLGIEKNLTSTTIRISLLKRVIATSNGISCTRPLLRSYEFPDVQLDEKWWPSGERTLFGIDCKRAPRFNEQPTSGDWVWTGGEVAARSREPAKGVINRKTSSRSKRDRSRSSSPIERPRARSVMTKPIDSSKITSRTFKKAGCRTKMSCRTFWRQASPSRGDVGIACLTVTV